MSELPAASGASTRAGWRAFGICSQPSSLRLLKSACQRKTVPVGATEGKVALYIRIGFRFHEGRSSTGVPGDVPASLDDIDRALIEHLRSDGRMPNKRLAKHLSVSEATVANRIRRLQEESVLRVLLRRDLYSKGFDLQCFRGGLRRGAGGRAGGVGPRGDRAGDERQPPARYAGDHARVQRRGPGGPAGGARERDCRGGRSGAGWNSTPPSTSESTRRATRGWCTSHEDRRHRRGHHGRPAAGRAAQQPGGRAPTGDSPRARCASACASC